jgi:membrane protease subunit (stomatin/prohibitin family)
MELAEILKTKLSTFFAGIGIKITDFNLENFSLPENVTKALDDSSALGFRRRNLDIELQLAQADAMKAAAGNPGMGGAGMSLGVGLAFGQQVVSGIKPVAPASTVAPTATIRCPKCNASIPVNSKFCPECGEKITASGKKFCPECGTENPAEAKFCKDCGHKF